MFKPDAQAIEQALLRFRGVLKELEDGEYTRLRPTDEFVRRLREDGASKGLRQEIDSFYMEVFVQSREQIWAGRQLRNKDADQSMEQLDEALEQLQQSITPPITPPPSFAEMDISPFAGGEHVEDKAARYEGDPNGVRPVFERSVELVRQYAEAIGRGDFEAAYAMTGAGLKAWMSLKRFVGSYERMAREHYGPAREFRILNVSLILADEKSRIKSWRQWNWPKATAKEDRRCVLGGFWITDPKDQTGIWGDLWVTEEDGAYRIVNFSFYIM